MIRLIIADDHQLIREGIKNFLRQEPDITIVGEAGTTSDLLPLMRSEPVDVILLDINMPGRSGIDVLSDIRREFPDTRILMLTMYSDNSLAIRSMKSGAMGYLTKNSSPEEMIQAIRKVAGGQRYVSETLAQQLLHNIGVGGGAEAHTSLSDREYEVFQLLGSGKSVTEIAELLSISLPTVSTYRARILEKMNITSTAEIIRYALKNKLVE